MNPREAKQILNEIITDEIRAKANEIEKAIIATRGEKLFNQHGAATGKIIRATAVKQAKKAIEKGEETPVEEPTNQEPEEMNEEKLREMVRKMLSKPLSEKKKSFPDLTGDGKITKADILKGRGVELSEDIDLGHEDDEPGMLKTDLYHIGKYAMELYKMMDRFESKGEVDFPHWWQSKIVKAKELISSAKHYLEFETKEPEIDAMVNVASQEDIINEKMTKKQVKKRGEIYDALKGQGMSDEKAGRIATAKAQKIKEAVLAALRQK